MVIVRSDDDDNSIANFVDTEHNLENVVSRYNHTRNAVVPPKVDVINSHDLRNMSHKGGVSPVILPKVYNGVHNPLSVRNRTE